MNPIPTLLSAVVVSSIIVAGASAQTADVGRALVASNILRLSADTTRAGQVSTLVKEFFVPYAGVVRMRWELKSDGTHGAFAFVTSQVDSCSSFTTAATFQPATCDLRVVAGDVVRAHAQGELLPGPSTFTTAFIRRVRVHYNVVNSTGLGKVLTD